MMLRMVTMLIWGQDNCDGSDNDHGEHDANKRNVKCKSGCQDRSDGFKL